MKNLKKLKTSDLKKIKGGNAPICADDEIPCHHSAQPGIPAYWTCEFAAYGCRD